MTEAHPNDKAARKAAATHAKDRSLYEVTEFGRKRLTSSPVRVAITVMGWLALLGVPFVFAYHWLRGGK